MIRLLACFHACEDLEVLSEQEWCSGSAEGRIDTSYLKKTINAYDESALELACRLKDSCRRVSMSVEEKIAGKPADQDVGIKAELQRELLCTTAAVTVAEGKRDLFSETLAAVGFDRVCRIIPEETEWERLPEAGSLSSEYTASLLYKWIMEQEPFDLILAGWQSGNGNHGKVPLILAELLGLRCITHVTDVRPVDARHAEVSWTENGDDCSAVIAFPAVLPVGTVSGTALRVPTLRQRMAVRGRKAEIIPAEELTADPVGSPVMLESMEVLTEERNGRLLEGLDAETAAASMWNCIRSKETQQQ